MESNDVTIAIKKSQIYELAAQGKRIDGRGLTDQRQIQIEENVIPRTAEGSCRVKIGNTDVIAGVKMSVATPFPDTPEEGVLMTNAELTPLSSPIFTNGPPSEFSIETARVVDRGIRESRMLDVMKLAITPGEAVWMVMVDLHTINYDGNLLDAFNLAAVKALLSAKMPKYEDGKIIREEKTGSLPINNKPVSTTFARFDEPIALDPNFLEEQTSSARLNIQTNQEGGLCAMQKMGIDSFKPKEIEDLIDQSVKIGKDIRKKYL